jgi:hypothetical protein
MKILAFTDIHDSLSALEKIRHKIKAKNPDILVCTGDISIFEHGLGKIMKKMNSLGKKIVIIHGNHEEEDTFAKHCKSLKNLVFIHKSHYIENDVLFIGYGGGGFVTVDKEFEKFSLKFSKLIKENPGKKVVLLTHAPPYKTSLDEIEKEHCGSKSLRNFVEKNRIDYMFCGHIHENFGQEDTIKKTKCINPGPLGKLFLV